MESCDIYIRSLRYQDSGWLNNPDELLELIYNNLTEIKDFYFVSLSLNMSNVYNVSLKQSNYESMIFYIKGVKYKHTEFLTIQQIKELEQKIKEQLGYIEKLYFREIEIRNSKVYKDIELGLVEPVSIVKIQPQIIAH